MKFYLFPIIVFMAFCHCSEGSPPSGLDKEGQTQGRAADDQTSQGTNTAIPKGSGSHKAYLDPETGELISPSEHEGAGRTETIKPSTNVGTTKEIVEEKSPVPGGGVMIDLKGRFHNPTAATVDGTGKSESGQRTSDTSE